MPERLPTARPDVAAGTILVSGAPNTGQLPFSFGGSRTFSSLSGATGADTRIWLGAGRLDYAQIIPNLSDPAASGLPIVFYDAAVATPVAIAPGPIAGSGHKVVGVLRPSSVASGAGQAGDQVRLGTVFTSGLCVSQVSGQPGFVASFTPVVSG